MTETEFHARYHIAKQEILCNRRAFHYFHEYVMSGRPEILGRAWAEIGRKGVVQIARWLGRIDSDILLAVARRQAAAIKGREAM